jgi:hypothetical protein
LAVVAAATATALAAPSPVVVTRGSGALPHGCAPSDVASVVIGFTDAFNRGDAQRLDELFAPTMSQPGESAFVRFSLDSAAGALDLTDRATLLPYLADRHKRNEMERLLFLDAVPNRSLGAGRVEVGIGLSAQADDYEGGSRGLVGRAVVNCASHTIADWKVTLQPAGFAFSGPGSCPRPRGWSTKGPVVACSEPPTAWMLADAFAVGKTTQSSPVRCGADGARTRLVSMLRALDYARPDGVAASFTPNGLFQPYSASLGTAVRGRSAIQKFATARVAAFDGWTASQLNPPLGRPSRTGTMEYTVALVAYTNGRPDGAGVARMTLDCGSGLIRSWTGPGLPLPR